MFNMDFDPVLESLRESEVAMIEAENTLNAVDMEYSVYQEGVASAVKNFLVKYAKKAWEFIKKIFTSMIGYIRKFINKVKELYKSAKNRLGIGGKLEKPVEEHAIVMQSEEKAEVKTKTASTSEDLYKTYTNACSSISTTVSKTVKGLARSESDTIKIIDVVSTPVQHESIDIFQERVEYMKNERDTIVAKSTGQSIKNYDLHTSTMQGQDSVDQDEKQLLVNFKEKEYKAILEAKDVVAAYNSFVNDCFEEMYNKKANAKDLKTGGQLITKLDFDEYSIEGYDKETLLFMMKSKGHFKTTKKVRNDDGTYSLEPLDANDVKKLIRLRINYNKKTRMLLGKMVEANYKLLHISEEKAKVVSNDIMTKTTKKAADAVFSLILKSAKAFIVKPGFIDFRPIGGGIIWYDPKSLPMSLLNTNPALLLTTSFRYDYIIYAHGAEVKGYWINVSTNGKLAELQIDGRSSGGYVNSAVKLAIDYIKTKDKIRASKGKKKPRSIYLCSCNPGRLSVDSDIEAEAKKENILIVAAKSVIELPYAAPSVTAVFGRAPNVKTAITDFDDVYGEKYIDKRSILRKLIDKIKVLLHIAPKKPDNKNMEFWNKDQLKAEYDKRRQRA